MRSRQLHRAERILTENGRVVYAAPLVPRIAILALAALAVLVMAVVVLVAMDATTVMA